jgi:hypothetical protein
LLAAALKKGVTRDVANIIGVEIIPAVVRQPRKRRIDVAARGVENLGCSPMERALPPGRGKLATRPALTGSMGTLKTIGIGIVAVAALAAAAMAAPLGVAMAATRRGMRSTHQCGQPIELVGTGYCALA